MTQIDLKFSLYIMKATPPPFVYLFIFSMFVALLAFCLFLSSSVPTIWPQLSTPVRLHGSLSFFFNGITKHWSCATSKLRLRVNYTWGVYSPFAVEFTVYCGLRLVRTVTFLLLRLSWEEVSWGLKKQWWSCCQALTAAKQTSVRSWGRLWLFNPNHNQKASAEDGCFWKLRSY